MEFDRIIDTFIARFIGTKHERDVKRISPLVVEINALEPQMKALSDAEMMAKTIEMKAQVTAALSDIEPSDPQYKDRLQAALQDVLPPAFALVREAGRRTLSMRHFDVQLIGGIVLHEGRIADIAQIVGVHQPLGLREFEPGARIGRAAGGDVGVLQDA